MSQRPADLINHILLKTNNLQRQIQVTIIDPLPTLKPQQIFKDLLHLNLIMAEMKIMSYIEDLIIVTKHKHQNSQAYKQLIDFFKTVKFLQRQLDDIVLRNHS